MTQFNRFLVIISAILYVFPFLWAQQLGWLVFVFPIPLFYAALTKQLGFAQGYFWGIIFFSFYLSGVLFSIVLLAEGSYFYRVIPPLFIVLYASLFSGITFSLATNISQYFFSTKPFYILLIWVASFWLFIHWMDWYVLFIFDRWEGCFFMHPLLPLVENSSLLWLLPIVGKSLLTFLLLMFSASVVMLLKTGEKKKVALVTFFFILPWFIGYFMSKKEIKFPIWLDKIVVFPMMFPSRENIFCAVEKADDYFKRILQQYPDVELIVMPESAFYYDNFKQESLTRLWGTEYLGHSIDIVFGAFRWKKNNYFNALHWIRNGILQTCFDKKHSMVLIERIPSTFNFFPIHDLYFKNLPEITPAQDKRPKLPIMKETAFVPYICSELFFNEYPDDEYPSTPILALCNDMWFHPFYHFPYVQRLMYLAAKFKAIQWQRNIVYVSFSRSVFLDQYGNEKSLKLYSKF